MLKQSARLLPFTAILTGIILGQWLITSGWLPAQEDRPAAPASPVVNLRSEGLPSQQSTGPAADTQRAVLHTFLENNPDINIESGIVATVGDSMDTSALMAIASGNAPDILYINFRISSSYVEHGFLEPLEVLLARLHSKNPRARQWDHKNQWLANPSRAEIDQALKELRARTADVVWPVVTQPDDSHYFGQGTHVWALPRSVMVRALLYRRDLFVQAGLDPDKPPRDWAELLEYARKLTVPQRRQYAFSFMPGLTISWQMYDFFVANGARALTRQPDGQYKASFGSREAAEAVYFFWLLNRGQFTTPDGQTLNGTVSSNPTAGPLWERGQLAMRLDYLNDEMLNGINPQQVGIAPEPRSWRGSEGSEVNSSMLGIFSGTTPEKQLAAMRYIWYATSDQASELTTRMLVQSGMGEFINPDLLKKYGYDQILKTARSGWFETYEHTLEHGVPEPFGKNTQTIYRIMSEPINAALELELNDVPREQAIAQIQKLLEDAASKADRTIFSNIPPAEMRTRRIIGGASMLAVVIAFVGGLAYVWRSFTKMTKDTSANQRPNRHRMWWAIGLLSPSLLLIIIWSYIPLVGGFGMSVVDYELVKQSIFVGVDNFANVLFDPVFWGGLLKTFYFVVLLVGLGFWPPILLAILLQEVPTNTAKYVYRTIYYLPAILSGVIVMFMWAQIYDPSPTGTLNQLLLSFNGLGPLSATIVKWMLLLLWISFIGFFLWLAWKLDELKTLTRAALALIGVALTTITLWPIISHPSNLANLVGTFQLEPLRWIQSPQLAMLCVVIPLVWSASGPGCLIYLAALKGIPDDLYEAADIDGAGFWQKIVYIALPRMKFLIVIQFIAAVIGAFKGGTDYILALTGGGPNGSTTILALEIFFQSFTSLNFGGAMAMAWLLGAMLIGFTAWQMKMLSRAEFKAAR